MAKPIRLVVFDNNGTAYDDLHIAYGSVYAIFLVLGIPCPTLEEYRSEITADFMQFYWDHGVPRTVTGDQLNVIRKLYYQARIGKAKYRYDFCTTLEALRNAGFILGMCSAEIHSVLIDALVAESLHSYFEPDMIVGSAWPTKVPTLIALADKAGVAPEECAYVDDTTDGILAAKEAGYFAVGFVHETGYNPEHRILSANPNAVAHSLLSVRLVLP